MKKEFVQETAKMLAGVFYPEELLTNYSHLLPKKFKEMERDYENGEEIPKEWEEFFEFMEERGYEQVSFSEYPEILKDWILKGVRETLKEADSRGAAWVTNYEDSVVFVKQKDGSYKYVHVEPFPNFPSFDDYQGVFFRQLIPLQKALENAVPQAWLNEDLFDLHKKLFELVNNSRKVIMGEGVRRFYRLHSVVYDYQKKFHGELDCFSPEKGKPFVEVIKELLDSLPDLPLESAWSIKLESSHSIRDEEFEKELREIVEKAKELEGKIREKGLPGEVFVVAHTSEGIRLSFSLRKAEEILEAVKRARECIHDGQIVVDRLIGNTFSEEDIDKMVELAENSDEMDFSP